VGLEELKTFFTHKGYYASDRELEGLLNRFDSEKCGKFSYEQFRRGLMQ
jgi:Ca2+-binding EF-hand superfamily protein